MRRFYPHRAGGRRGRLGFTLVELLVVITIIAVLMGLLLPAVQAARESARRTVCQNNLYQLAFASLRHNDQNGFLPGWRNAIGSGTTAYTWMMPLFPFIERKDIFNSYASNAGQAVFVQTLVCPTSPPDAQNSAFLSYGGCVGMGSGTTVAQRSAGVMVDTTIAANRITLDDVSSNDGAATTMILSEKCGSLLGTATLWSGINPTAWTAGYGMITTGSTTKIINSGTISSSAPSASNMPSSQHPGGAVAAFCDGHTQFVKESLMRQVYAQLSSWNHTSGTGATPYSTWVQGYAVLNESDY
ncbi:MAG: DUF1559 domain-containing protein [Gemmata sp.]